MIGSFYMVLDMPAAEILPTGYKPYLHGLNLLAMSVIFDFLRSVILVDTEALRLVYRIRQYVDSRQNVKTRLSLGRWKIWDRCKPKQLCILSVNIIIPRCIDTGPVKRLRLMCMPTNFQCSNGAEIDLVVLAAFRLFLMSSKNIYYSEKYYDDLHEYRHVHLPKEIAKKVPKNRLMSEYEWRELGIQQSAGWVHYMIHEPEPHIILFRRPRTDIPAPSGTGTNQEAGAAPMKA
ncbi:Cyclin-dependent kinases regulatory subunit 2 [Clonorchis sinensis]|uniref:Cyclin-dependent kinases regulatory subunit n=1 Tax=Clonorchis sinensis TaxID=79923 RepID=A0A419PWL4_CLOSI|nr:Cyclin-dependent kinases regulatory subunit 2 [Clonorchis sinensis]